MNKVLTAAIAVLASAFAYSVVAMAPQTYATGNNTSGCLDPKNKSNYETKIQRGTGTITVKGGKALCAAQDMVFESFNVPDTWDRKGWNKTAIPQTKYASTLFTIPAGVANYTKTVTVTTPDECKNTQLDFYFAPEYASVTTLTSDDERNLQGVLFAGKGNCEEPTKPKEIQVCELSTYTIITIKEDEFDAKKHSKDTANCKKPVEMCPIEGLENLPADSSKCVEPVTPTPKPEPETPVTLPETGLGEMFAPIMGVGSLTASGYYYLTSLRNRKK